jgi:hypothetical protein
VVIEWMVNRFVSNIIEGYLPVRMNCVQRSGTGSLAKVAADIGQVPLDGSHPRDRILRKAPYVVQAYNPNHWGGDTPHGGEALHGYSPWKGTVPA